MTFTLGQTPAATPGAGTGDLVKDSTADTFVADVIEASLQTPVIVDFWAPWCGPCKQLTPILEKVVKAAGGKVRLVKVNIDENQLIAQQMRIQSIPAVIAFKGGQPVDGFMGALPESQVRSFVERLAGGIGPSPVDQVLDMAEQALSQNDLGNAAQLYAEVLGEDKANARALGGLVQCYVAHGDLEQAEKTLAVVPPEAANDPAVVSARAKLQLAQGPKADSSEVAALKAKIEADANDHAARFDLALALNTQNDQAGAVDHLLEIIRRDRSWNEEAARKQLLTLFEAFGPTDPLTVSGRRRLSSILFS
ncbi:MAG: thioredoxin [Alphaproteobacteria bacterium]